MAGRSYSSPARRRASAWPAPATWRPRLRRGRGQPTDDTDGVVDLARHGRRRRRLGGGGRRPGWWPDHGGIDAVVTCAGLGPGRPGRDDAGRRGPGPARDQLLRHRPGGGRGPAPPAGPPGPHRPHELHRRGHRPAVPGLLLGRPSSPSRGGPRPWPGSSSPTACR